MANPSISPTFTNNHITKPKGPLTWGVPSNGSVQLITIPLVNHTGQESFAIVDGANNIVEEADILSRTWSQGGVTLGISFQTGYATPVKVLIYSVGTISQEQLDSNLLAASTINITPDQPLSVISGDADLDWLARAGKFKAADKTKLDSIAANANNYSHPNHSGEVTSTGDGAQAVQSAAITNKTAITAIEASDLALLSDTSDGANLKKITLENLRKGLIDVSYEEDINTFTTTSAIESTVLTLSKPVIAWKDYYIFWDYLLQNSNTSGDAQGRVRVNTPDNVLLQDVRMEPKDSLNLYPCGGMSKYTPTTSGTMEIAITLANIGSGTSSLFNPKLLVKSYL